MATPLHRELAELRANSPVSSSPHAVREREQMKEKEEEAGAMAAQLMEALQQLQEEQDVLDQEAARLTTELAEQKQLTSTQAEKIGALEAQLASGGGDTVGAGGTALDELAVIGQKCEELNELNQRLVAEHNERTEALQAEIVALKAAAPAEAADPRQSEAWLETARDHAAEIDTLRAQIAQLEAAGSQQKIAKALSAKRAEGSALAEFDADEAEYAEEDEARAAVASAVDDTRWVAEGVTLVEAQANRLAQVTQDALSTLKQKHATLRHTCDEAELVKSRVGIELAEQKALAEVLSAQLADAVVEQTEMSAVAAGLERAVQEEQAGAAKKDDEIAELKKQAENAQQQQMIAKALSAKRAEGSALAEFDADEAKYAEEGEARAAAKSAPPPPTNEQRSGVDAVFSTARTTERTTVDGVFATDDLGTGRGVEDAAALVEAQTSRLADVTQDALSTLKQKHATLQHRCDEAAQETTRALIKVSELQAAAVAKEDEVAELNKQAETAQQQQKIATALSAKRAEGSALAEFDADEAKYAEEDEARAAAKSAAPEAAVVFLEAPQKAGSEEEKKPSPLAGLPPLAGTTSDVPSEEIYTDEDFEDVSELDTSYGDGASTDKPGTAVHSGSMLLDDELVQRGRAGGGDVSPEAVALVEEQGARLQALMVQYTTVSNTLAEERQARTQLEDVLDMERRAAGAFYIEES